MQLFGCTFKFFKCSGSVRSLFLLTFLISVHSIFSFPCEMANKLYMYYTIPDLRVGILPTFVNYDGHQ